MFNRQKAYSKSNRVKNPKLLEAVRKQPCLICKKIGSCDPHHIKSVGSGGSDVEDNLIPLCREHHTDIHKLGLNRMAAKFSSLSIWLSKNGWEFNPTINKWRKDNVKSVIV